MYIPPICLECFPLTFLLNLYLSFNIFLGPVSLSWVLSKLSYIQLINIVTCLQVGIPHWMVSVIM